MQIALVRPMDIDEPQHREKLLLLLVIESARLCEQIWILIGAEKHIPPHKVTIVVLVPLMLVMNPMHLRALKNVTDPERRGHVRVIEELPQSCKRCIDRPATEGQAKK